MIGPEMENRDYEKCCSDGIWYSWLRGGRNPSREQKENRTEDRRRN